ncbi:hypothetical protein [Nocardioides yefusunii]|uniref:Terpene cyclase/mutase family protein n=1 Tax=Nocardioides yefusunii TaxID=2500546 RepID=A0ABW1QY04_9ACTN|nr:hypothetical protein [Nocardioides yefusunii]
MKNFLTPRPVVLALAAAALAATSLAGCSSQDDDAAAGSTAAASETAASWVLDELNDGSLLEVTSSWEGETSTNVDLGGSIDLVLALDAVEQAADRSAKITDAVAADLATYVGAGTEIYSGASAKALVLALSQERDATDFGGLDLVERVESTVTREGEAQGRISDSSEYGDYANTLGQAYAAAGLTLAGSPLADDAVDFLLDQQCEAGFFRLDFAAADAAEQDCDAAGDLGDQAADVTAIVAVQLAAVAEKASDDVSEALDDARAWLVSQQAEDGSFADPENGVNANSTGLAGWALRDLGATAEADKAAAWLTGLQITEGERGKLADEIGALAYDTAALEAGREHGITDPLDRTQWVRVAAQVVPALSAPAAK